MFWLSFQLQVHDIAMIQRAMAGVIPAPNHTSECLGVVATTCVVALLS